MPLLTDGLLWKAKHSIHPGYYVVTVGHGEGRKLVTYSRGLSLAEIRAGVLPYVLKHMQKRILFVLRKRMI